MSFTPKPHVSSALQHLRFSVAGAALVLGACIVIQMLIWAFAHFTDVRWTTVEKAPTHTAPVVVQPHRTGEPMPGEPPIEKVLSEAPERAADVNTVLSRNDRYFRSISALAVTFGVLSSLILSVVMLQGVVIAGGAAVPGVYKAVTAATWSLLIALLCLPVRDLLPSFPYAGVFWSYDAMTASSEAIRSKSGHAPSGFVFFGQHCIVPLAVVLLLTIIVLRFRAGVEQGVIATSMSELDEKLERELNSIKIVSSSAPRAVGALNRAIGDTVAPPVSNSLTRGMRGENQGGKRIGEPQTGDPLPRPI